MATVVGIASLTLGCSNQPVLSSASSESVRQSSGSGAVQVDPSSAIPIATPTDLVEPAARRLFGNDFAGIDVIDGQVTVFKRGIVPDLRATELSNIPVQSVEYSLQQLEEIRNKIETNSAALKRNGVALYTVAIQPKNNKVGVEVSNDLPRAVEEITKFLGPDSPVAITEEPNPIVVDVSTLVPTSAPDKKEPH